MPPNHNQHSARQYDSESTISAQHDSLADVVVDKPEANYVGLNDMALDDVEMDTDEYLDSAPLSQWVTHSPHLRECLAEFFGTFVMVAFGLGVNNEVDLSKAAKGTFLSINMCWGIALMLGVHIADGVSGAHLNPAVTFAMATFHRLPWRKVPGYVLAQCLGAFCAAIPIYALYYQVLQLTDPQKTFTRAIFVSFPSDDISNLTAFYTEFLATAMLLVGVFAITDKRNCGAQRNYSPVHFMLLLWGIGMAFGRNTSYAINPARDIGPRLFICLAGWGSAVFTVRSHYFWVPLVGPSLGGLVGAGAYKLFIGNHHPRHHHKHIAAVTELPV
jgi:MIP family channel proteins